MANYACATRTNYFRVTDETAYSELFNHLHGEDSVIDLSSEINGITYHAFGCYATIGYFEEDDDVDYDMTVFAQRLQTILPEDEAFILFEAGNEKLRYVTGEITIITKHTVDRMSLENMAMQKCKEILGDHFKTRLNY